ncbi:MAG: quinolinate synthase NadA [Proteobacteria bacterium]|nr:quinolinate synthase NadA [Pseudomonadota bacterium]
MFMEDIIKEIEKIKKEKRAIILAHNYQRPEVQDIADFVGDSLELSTKAKDTDAEIIIFCGVHFMAETAKILSPQKKVILPRMDAGCPMADMVTPDGLRELKNKYPEYKVVTYVNSTASVKALSDSCCTSSNAINIVKNIDSNKILFVPDRNLAHYVSRFVKKEIIPWQGFCPTHERLEVKDILARKKDFPDAKVLVHPECKPEVVDIADKALSTSGIIKFCHEDNSKYFIIGTEMGILHRLKKENPEKEFILASDRLVCPNMKLTRLEDIYRALTEEEGIIELESEVINKAKEALLNMYRLNY